MRKIASVLLDDALDRPLDYEIPDHLGDQITEGVRVDVPVRGSIRKGTVVERKSHSPFEKLQAIAALSGRVPSELFPLASWMARYYGTPLRKIVRSILPPSIRDEMKEKTQLFVRPLLSKNQLAQLCAEKVKKSAAQARILEAILQEPKGLLLSELLEASGTTRSPVDALVKQKVLHCSAVKIDRTPLEKAEYLRVPAKKLNQEQQAAFDAICESLDAKTFKTHLIFGITGSGKTEIYLRAIERTLESGAGVILLVPEIALTSQTVERLRARFEEKVAIIHHRLSAGERRDTWHAIADGKISLVIGARSALFAPLKNLGLIIVDEEQEASYKQSDEMPAYHARDVAIMRAKLCNATCVLGSATPSLESYTNALSGKYQLSTLKTRPKNAKLPVTDVVDMRREFEKNNGFTLFSDKLIGEIKERMERGEQSLLFLNRRGYHSSRVCGACGETDRCPHCDLSLTFHREKNTLTCHMCGFELSPPPLDCTHCNERGQFQFKGVGTEQVERAIHAILPEIRTIRLDADTTRHKGSHERLFREFRSGKADLLIGTQMIAKGLHFPMVTLVGVLNADGALQIPDFRSAEQLFQLLTQVSGRAGRADLEGKVILQTSLPDHPAIQLAIAQDYDGFYKQELEIRKTFNFPPFCQLAKVQFSGPDMQITENSANGFRNVLLKSLPKEAEIQPFMPCGHAKIKDRYRFHCLIKAPDIRPVTQAVASNLEKMRFSKGIRVHLDINPVSTFF